MIIFKNKTIPPESLNEHGQITDKKLLSSDRYKFGVANIMYQGEEVGLGPIHTVIIRALGGNALHIGIIGAIGSVGSMLQWIGTLLLRKLNSNKKALAAALSFGVALAALTAFFIFLPVIKPGFQTFGLWGYLILSLFLAGATGVQWNIETSWIGDLVPKKILGWFTSVKWAVAVFGILCFMILFGKLVDYSPTLPTYAGVYGIVAVSHVIAILLISSITDRVPRNANFISAGAGRSERLNYKAPPLWTYISFYVLWGSGRVAMFSFTTAYLLDQFHYSMTKIMAITAIQSVISILFLLFLGKITDLKGHRIPLIIVSGVISITMLLWVFSGWWGILPIIVYMFLNGAAGHSHSMLAMNYALEIFPDKGRSGYIAFSRFFIGGACFGMTILAGIFMRRIEGWQTTIMGATFSHYHLFFLLCAILTFFCIVPLIIIGKRTVHAAPETADGNGGESV